MSLPKTYKAVVVKAANEPVTLTDQPMPTPQANEVLVKVQACGVCFSDVAVLTGHMGEVFPRVPGHEVIGKIVQTGPGVSNFSIGQRVGGPWHGGHDGNCKQCRKGLFQMCDNRTVNGVYRNGGWAEYVVLRAEAVVRIPDGVDAAEAAPLLCAGVTVFNSIRKMKVEQGGLVAVSGLGGLGHLAIQYANKMGYEVAALSTSDDKMQFAKDLGAHHFINTKKNNVTKELKKLGGADIVVQTATNPSVVPELMAGMAPTGKLINLAPVGEVKVDTVSMVVDGLSIHGWPSGHAQDSEDAIRFAQNHGVKCMIEKYKFEDAAKAVESLKAGKPRFRNVLVME